MLSAINRAWRVIATGVCFASFGLGGLLLRILVFPCVGLLVRDRARRRQVSRRVIRFVFRSFVAQMRVMGIYTYELRNLERLQRDGLLVIANHPTLIDVVFLMAFVRNADCVVKAALWRNPFMRGPIRAADYVSNAAGPDMVDACIESIRQGGNLILFPEGTRSVPGAGFEFQRGASNIAVRGALALTPVYIECKPVMLTKGEKWYRVPDRAPHFVFSVGEDIPVAPYLQSGAPLALAARRLTQDLERHYAQELAGHG